CIPAALGTDTGGSIRGPASFCGIAGLKPTFGLVSRHGVLPNSYSFDHVGPMARTVEDCAILLEALAGYDPRDPVSLHAPHVDYRRISEDRDLKATRIGVLRGFWEQDVHQSDEVAHAMKE